MDEQQIKDWLGIRDTGKPLLEEIVEGMRDVDFPCDDAGHMEVFTAFLRCAPKPPAGVFATETQKWLDHEGNVFEARFTDPPTAYRWDDGYTHKLLRPRPGQLIQALTVCGKRGLEIPGRGDVTCPRCKDTDLP